MFPPGVARLAVPIRVIDNNIPEPPEVFRLSLFQVIESPTVELAGARADVTITDEDGMFCNVDHLHSRTFYGRWYFSYAG